jgi:hypothetical protein
MPDLHSGKVPPAVQLNQFSMGSQLLSPNREAAIWARLIRTLEDDVSSEAAEFLLSIGFEESDRQRMLKLAEQSEAGILTADEQAEFDSYLHVGNLLAVMQSKARLALKKKLIDRHHS